MADIVLTGVVQADGSVKVEGADLPQGMQVRVVVQFEASGDYMPIGVTLAQLRQMTPREMSPDEEAEYNRIYDEMLAMGRDDLGLPPAYADELDHYLYGTPKR